MNGPIPSLYFGFLKTTLVHRHAFIPSLAATKEIGCGARVPSSFWPAVEETALHLEGLESRVGACQWRGVLSGLKGDIPQERVLAGILRLYGSSSGKEGMLEGLIERYANAKGLRDLEIAVERWPDWWPGCVWLGLALLRRCDFPKARVVLDELVRRRPDWAWSYLLRSELGRVDIEFKASLADLEKAKELEPDNAWLYAFRSRVRFQMSPEPSALEDLNRAVALDPKAGWLRAWRGDARRKLGDAKGALRDLLLAKSLEPSYDRTYLWLGKVLHSMGLEKRALAVLNEACRRCPHFEKAFSQRSQVLRTLGRVPEALADLNRAVRVNHRHNWLGNWTAEPAPLRPDQKESMTALDRMSARSPWALAWRGESKVQIGDLEGGLADLDEALRRSPDLAWAYAWRGEAFVRLRKFPEAESDLERAVRLDPGYGRAYAWRGRLRQLQRRFGLAVADYEKAVGDSLVEYSWLYFWRGQAQAGLGRSEAARRDFETAYALENRPEFLVNSESAIETLDALSHWERLENLSSLFSLPFIAEYELSFFRNLYHPELRRALAALGDGSARSLAYRGRVRRIFGDLAGAARDLKLALDKDPDLASAHAWLGELDLRGPQALESLSRAIALDEGLACAYLYRGAARLLSGERRKAKADLERFIALKPASGLGRLLAGQYRAAAEINPACASAWFLSGRAEKALDADPTYALITLSKYRPGASWSGFLGRMRRFAFEEPERAGWYYRQEDIHYSPYQFKEFEDSSRLVEARPGAAWALALQGRGTLRCPLDPARTEAGLEALNKAIRLSPKSGWIYSWRALAWVKMGEPEKALEDFASSIRLQPFYHRAYAWRAGVLRKLGRSEEALLDLDRAVAVDDQYAFAWHERSLTRRALGDWAGAALDLDRAFVWDFRYNWVFTTGREPGAGEVERGIAELDRACLAQAHVPSLLAWRGQLKLQKGDFSAAFEDFESASQLDPHCALALGWYGRGLVDAGQPERSLEFLTKAVELEPKIWIYRGWLAEAEFGRGEAKKAFAILDEVLAAKPKTWWVYHLRSRFNIELKRPRLALSDMRESLGYEGRHADGYYLEAQARLDLKDLKGAENAVGKALVISPNMGRAYVLRAEIRRRRGQARGALADYRTAYDRFPYLFNDEEKRRIEDIFTRLGRVPCDSRSESQGGESIVGHENDRRRSIARQARAQSA